MPIEMTRYLPLALCIAAAFFEGVDMVSMSLAVPWMKSEFAFPPSQLGPILSASLLGMVVGALGGGRIADRIGRKKVLIGSMVALGLFSLGTTMAWNFPSFLVIRLLVGLGLGGAFPILIALAAEYARPEVRATAISIVYCAQPIGGAVVSIAVGIFGAALGWRGIFLIGAIGPLLVAPVLAAFLPESARFAAAKTSVAAAPEATRPNVLGVLFGEGRATATLLLWSASLFTLAVIYLLLNWIPSLMIGKGLTREQGAMAAVMLHGGSAIGAVVCGIISDRGHRRLGIVAAYSALVASLFGLVGFSSFGAMLVFSATTGFCMLGCQLILYSVAADLYPTLVRATGVGGAISVGRIGSIIGPLVAGALLSQGFGASAVIAAAIPGVAISAVCAVILMLLLHRPRLEMAPASA